MGAYITKRLALIVPTIFGILLINFVLIQFVPGGPVEQILAQIDDENASSTDRISGGGDAGSGGGYTGGQGLPEDFIADLEAQFGFDKPAWQRFAIMVWDYARLDFGESYFRSVSVLDLILEKMPVSITLGLWSTLAAYLISIPLGIRKAVEDGAPFDTWTSGIIIVAYAIPSFLFAILLIVLFAGGSYFQLFPLRGLSSPDADTYSFAGQVLDYFWHIALPVLATTIGSFATLTLLTKNSFLDEIRKQYVMTARAKGVSEAGVLYAHVFRNAMLIVVAGAPGALISVLFTSSLIIEVIFSLDGLGRLTFDAVVSRDYPVFFGTLFVFSLIGLFMNLVTDLMYVLIDPRIDFETRET
ncbi:MAG: microcin C ABC transporter permease YejB [Pseudomonadota bacterium]